MSNENLSKLLALTADIEAMDFCRIYRLYAGNGRLADMVAWRGAALDESSKWGAAFNEFIK